MNENNIVNFSIPQESIQSMVEAFKDYAEKQKQLLGNEQGEIIADDLLKRAELFHAASEAQKNFIKAREEYRNFAERYPGQPEEEEPADPLPF